MRFVHVPHLLVELLAFLFFPISLNHYDMYRSGLVLWWWYLKTISCGGKSLGGVELWSSHLIMTCSVIFRIWHVVPADWLAQYDSLIRATLSVYSLTPFLRVRVRTGGLTCASIIGLQANDFHCVTPINAK